MLLWILLVLVSMLCTLLPVMYIVEYGFKEIRIKDAILIIIFFPGALVVFIIVGIILLFTSDRLNRKIFKQDK